jgi:hypothetical protein
MKQFIIKKGNILVRLVQYIYSMGSLRRNHLRMARLDSNALTMIPLWQLEGRDARREEGESRLPHPLCEIPSPISSYQHGVSTLNYLHTFCNFIILWVCLVIPHSEFASSRVACETVN